MKIRIDYVIDGTPLNTVKNATAEQLCDAAFVIFQDREFNKPACDRLRTESEVSQGIYEVQMEILEALEFNPQYIIERDFNQQIYFHRQLEFKNYLLLAFVVLIVLAVIL